MFVAKLEYENSFDVPALRGHLRDGVIEGKRLRVDVIRLNVIEVAQTYIGQTISADDDPGARALCRHGNAHQQGRTQRRLPAFLETAHNNGNTPISPKTVSVHY